MVTQTWRVEPDRTALYTDPGQDGEEAEGDGCPGSVGALGQWQLFWSCGLPLIGQKAEANKPKKAGQT